MGDPWSEPTAVAWSKWVVDEMAPKLAGSEVAVSLAPPVDLEDATPGDVKYWVELGAMICADKPIIVVVVGDRPLPPKLAAVADELVRCPEGIDPAASEELVAALERIREVS